MIRKHAEIQTYFDDLMMHLISAILQVFVISTLIVHLSLFKYFRIANKKKGYK